MGTPWRVKKGQCTLSASEGFALIATLVSAAALSISSNLQQALSPHCLTTFSGNGNSRVVYHRPDLVISLEGNREGIVRKETGPAFLEEAMGDQKSHDAASSILVQSSFVC